jgi:hypothetical protein
VSQPASLLQSAVADSWGPLVSSLSPQISPPLLARVATPAKLPVMGRPPVTIPSPSVTCNVEPSHQLWCVVASHHRCPPMSALVGTAGCPASQERYRAASSTCSRKPSGRCARACLTGLWAARAGRRSTSGRLRADFGPVAREFKNSFSIFHSLSN